MIAKAKVLGVLVNSTRPRRLLLVVAVLLISRPGLAQFSSPVQVRIVAQKRLLTPGDQLALAVVMAHDPTWKTWPGEGLDVLPPDVDRDAIRTRLIVGKLAPGESVADPTVTGGTLPEVLTVGPIQWGELQDIEVASIRPEGPPTIVVQGYKNRVVHYVPILVAPDAPPGKFTIEIHLYYQACDPNQCIAPEAVIYPADFEIVTAGLAAGAPLSAPDQELFAKFDLSVFASLRSGSIPAATVEFNVFGLAFAIDASGVGGWLLILLLAALGGFVLNLTPCVLPVIPLKIMGLSQAAGQRARCFYLGAVTSLGVVFFFVAVGGLIAGLSSFNQISSLFQRPWFTIGVGVLIAGLSLGMFGFFHTRLPQWVYRITPQHDSTGGSFAWGILTAVLSTPCTAPFMGAATGWATQQQASITLATFGAIGVGMALPYLILSANPKWLAKVPKSGPGSELVKQVMGLFLLAVAAFFLGTGLGPYLKGAPTDPTPTAHWWLVMVFGVAAAGWLVVRTWMLTKSSVARILWSGFGIGAAVITVGSVSSLTSKGPIDWVYYTPERHAEAVARGDVIVTDFTAEWCLNCKAIEIAVLFRKEVYSALNGEGVTPIKVDLTGNNAVGSAKLEEYRWRGIPLLVVEGPGISEPIKFGDGYTVKMVLDAIARARGAS